MTKIVWLDCGHGGKDSGAVNKELGLLEKDLALRVGLGVRDILQYRGIKPIMTRSSDKDMSYKERVALENKQNCQCAVSIHLNGFGDKNANGFEGWVSSKPSERQLSLGKSILNNIEKISPYKNRGLKRGYIADETKDFWVNRLTRSASVLLEIGFITNNSEAEHISSNIGLYARAIANGILEFLGEKPLSSEELGEKIPKPSPRKAKDKNKPIDLCLRGKSYDIMYFLSKKLPSGESILECALSLGLLS